MRFEIHLAAIFLALTLLDAHNLFPQAVENEAQNSPALSGAAAAATLRSDERDSTGSAQDEAGLDLKGNPFLEFALLGSTALGVTQPKPGLPFSKMFRYETNPSDPDHRCYEITKPISRNYTFLFNFMPLERFTSGGAR